MPKRKTHRPTISERRGFKDPRRRSFPEKLVDSPFWPAMFAAIEAEARGEVAGALEIVEKTGEGPGREQFWHPLRVERLQQLRLLGESVPRWARSRWIVAQAMQGTHARNRWRMAKAIDAALDIRGGPDPFRDREDDRIRIMDRDWVYRQLFLYELGGLEAFLRHDASAGLIAGADRIWEWSRAPMRGVRLLGRGPQELVWEDVRTGEQVSTINIGAGVFVDDGDCAIGRIVPIEGGAMFETAPLGVPEEMAYAVADEPERWADAMRDLEPGTKLWVTRGLNDYGLLTDVPYALVSVAMDAGLHAFHHPDDDDLDELFTHPADYPACLAAWLVRPATIEVLRAGMPADALTALESFAAYVHEPAASLIGGLAEAREEAA